MRHQNRLKKLNRPADQRKALVRGLVTEVLRHGRITTTKVPSRAGLVARRSACSSTSAQTAEEWRGHCHQHKARCCAVLLGGSAARWPA